MKQEKGAVLVVEDEPLVRRMAAEIISNAGWTAVEASNSREALALLGNHPDVKVLFTDLELPGAMSGMQLSERVHRIRPDVELVVTSARGSVARSQLPDDGTFLRKPYRLSDLVRVLREKLC